MRDATLARRSIHGTRVRRRAAPNGWLGCRRPSTSPSAMSGAPPATRPIRGRSRTLPQRQRTPAANSGTRSNRRSGTAPGPSVVATALPTRICWCTGPGVAALRWHSTCNGSSRAGLRTRDALRRVPPCSGRSRAKALRCRRNRQRPSAAMTSLVVMTAATFCMAYCVEARCQSAFMVEQQSSGTMTK